MDSLSANSSLRQNSVDHNMKAGADYTSVDDNHEWVEDSKGMWVGDSGNAGHT